MASTLDSQTCKLCLETVGIVGGLRKSHIIPKFMLKHSKDRKGQSVILIGSIEDQMLHQFDWKENMLCASCEHRVKFYEDFMNETFFLHRKNEILSNDRSIVRFAGSNDMMALGLLSIFWRAVQAGMTEFRWAFAPHYVSSDLRSWIFNRKLPPNWQKLISIEIVQIVDQNCCTVPLVSTPFIRPYPDKFEFVFSFSGYVVTFTIPPNENLASGRFMLRQGFDIIRIRKIFFGAVPEFAKFFRLGKEGEKIQP